MVDVTMLPNYGAGRSRAVLVQQEGPERPPANVIAAAHQALNSKVEDAPCLDCLPNIVLKDYICDECGDWEWGMIVAHDDTCPFVNGVVDRAGGE